MTNERIGEIARQTRSYLETGMRAGWNPLYVETVIAETLVQALASEPSAPKLRVLLADAWWDGALYTGERSCHAMKQACDAMLREKVAQEEPTQANSTPLTEEITLVLRQIEMTQYREDNHFRPGIVRPTREEWHERATWLAAVLSKVNTQRQDVEAMMARVAADVLGAGLIEHRAIAGDALKRFCALALESLSSSAPVERPQRKDNVAAAIAKSVEDYITNCEMPYGWTSVGLFHVVLDAMTPAPAETQEEGPAGETPVRCAPAPAGWSDGELACALISQVWRFFDVSGFSHGRSPDADALERARDLLDLPRPPGSVNEWPALQDQLSEARHRVRSRGLRNETGRPELRAPAQTQEERADCPACAALQQWLGPKGTCVAHRVEAQPSPETPASESKIDAIRRIRLERGVPLREARRLYDIESAETPETRKDAER
jgi:hypothetical protein